MYVYPRLDAFSNDIYSYTRMYKFLAVAVKIFAIIIDTLVHNAEAYATAIVASFIILPPRTFGPSHLNPFGFHYRYTLVYVRTTFRTDLGNSGEKLQAITRRRVQSIRVNAAFKFQHYNRPILTIVCTNLPTLFPIQIRVKKTTRDDCSWFGRLHMYEYTYTYRV